MGFDAAVLVAAQLGEARRGAQFPELCFLLLGDAQGFAIEFLSSLGMPLLQQQTTFVSIKLRQEPALSCPVYNMQSVVQQVPSLVNLPCDFTRLSQERDMIGVNIAAPVAREAAKPLCRSDTPSATSPFLTFSHPRWIVPSEPQKGKPCSVATAINGPTCSPRAASSPSSECTLAPNARLISKVGR